LADFAQPAPALDDAYKDDFVLFATECVIKAVESRLAQGAQNRQALADQALAEGFVLTPGLAEGLVTYEKQQDSLRIFFPEWIGKIDLAREDKRLGNVQFAKRAGAKTVKAAPPPPEPELPPVEKALAEAEALYTQRDLEQARAQFSRVLQQPAAGSLHAKAYYGLARIAALQRDPELAERLFEKTLDLSPDDATKSWAHLYLARLADARGDRAAAETSYRAALAVAGAPESVKSAAEKGLAQPFRPAQ
jgi:tetratricopeptide (TPR) repeat protein